MILCESQEPGYLTLSCPGNDVIIVTYANYGRTATHLEVCPFTGDHNDDTNCITGTTWLRSLCNGLSSCVVQMSTVKAQLGDPCQRTYKYIEYRYICAPKVAGGIAIK